MCGQYEALPGGGAGVRGPGLGLGAGVAGHARLLALLADVAQPLPAEADLRALQDEQPAALCLHARHLGAGGPGRGILPRQHHGGRLPAAALAGDR